MGIIIYGKNYNITGLYSVYVLYLPRRILDVLMIKVDVKIILRFWEQSLLEKPFIRKKKINSFLSHRFLKNQLFYLCILGFNVENI